MRIPLNTSTIGEAEKAAVKAVLDSGRLTMGECCRAFEQAFADYLGVEHAVMVNSGSSANLIALFALANPLVPEDGARPRRIQPGAEVIVPALTWSTTIWPVLQAGAKPVFVDCDPGTLQMTPAAIEAAITPATAAIVVVHVLGGAVDVAGASACGCSRTAASRSVSPGTARRSAASASLRASASIFPTTSPRSRAAWW
jgi:CDP-6-deoxy-D-xylo-4-hexulose-3-dehydrase